MSTELFFDTIRNYTDLSSAAEAAWARILHRKVYKKGENFVSEGQISKRVAFVINGLFSQYYTTDSGEIIIKYFFPERRLAGSISSILSKSPGIFTITAIENTTVLEYDFFEFKKLVQEYKDIASFYIRYMELHWIIEKEPLEISFRHDTAKTRYDEFVKKYPLLIKRLKKHHIASYLGITPTQLSRIFFANK
ncbi:MAG TPA: Crp/Fnr family transcriptional regulator [Chitinophagaceae bacterium]|nr:Crp/Fnr family transcriptional regulator [Chitinophagaceae bacterium]